MSRLHVGVLAIQGNFREHIAALMDVGLTRDDITLVREAVQLDEIDALIVPGGESTAMTRIVQRSGLLEPLQHKIDQELPCFGSCAGMILLAHTLEPPDERVHTFGALDITVKRNAFGRQNESFEASLSCPSIGSASLEAVFIRAPIITEVRAQAQVLATVDEGPYQGCIVAAQQGKNIVTAFHPEMTSDRRVHQYFLELCT